MMARAFVENGGRVFIRPAKDPRTSDEEHAGRSASNEGDGSVASRVCGSIGVTTDQDGALPKRQRSAVFRHSQYDRTITAVS